MKTLVTILTITFCVNTFAADKLTGKIEANTQSGSWPLSVQFSCPDVSPETVYFWDLGNGTISYDRNPVSLYVNPGTYKVKLEVRNGDVTESNTTTIQVLPNPKYIEHLASTRNCIE